MPTSPPFPRAFQAESLSKVRPLTGVGDGSVSSRKGHPSSAQHSRWRATSRFLQRSGAPLCSLRPPPPPPPKGRLPRQSLNAGKHVASLLLAAAEAGSTEPRGCKLGRNNCLCQSPFLSPGQTKGTPPCSPPRGEVCGGNRETHHCDPGSSAEFPTLRSGGGGWAGAGGVEERLTERERQRFSERPWERRQTAGENFCELTVPGTGMGGHRRRKQVWKLPWSKGSLVFILGASLSDNSNEL